MQTETLHDLIRKERLPGVPVKPLSAYKLSEKALGLIEDKKTYLKKHKGDEKYLELLDKDPVTYFKIQLKTYADLKDKEPNSTENWGRQYEKAALILAELEGRPEVKTSQVSTQEIIPEEKGENVKKVSPEQERQQNKERDIELAANLSQDDLVSFKEGAAQVGNTYLENILDEEIKKRGIIIGEKGETREKPNKETTNVEKESLIIPEDGGMAKEKMDASKAEDAVFVEISNETPEKNPVKKLEDAFEGFLGFLGDKKGLPETEKRDRETITAENPIYSTIIKEGKFFSDDLTIIIDGQKAVVVNGRGVSQVLDIGSQEYKDFIDKHAKDEKDKIMNIVLTSEASEAEAEKILPAAYYTAQVRLFDQGVLKETPAGKKLEEGARKKMATELEAKKEELRKVVVELHEVRLDTPFSHETIKKNVELSRKMEQLQKEVAEMEAIMSHTNKDPGVKEKSKESKLEKEEEDNAWTEEDENTLNDLLETIKTVEREMEEIQKEKDRREQLGEKKEKTETRPWANQSEKLQGFEVLDESYIESDEPRKEESFPLLGIEWGLQFLLEGDERIKVKKIKAECRDDKLFISADLKIEVDYEGEKTTAEGGMQATIKNGIHDSLEIENYSFKDLGERAMEIIEGVFGEELSYLPSDIRLSIKRGHSKTVNRIWIDKDELKVELGGRDYSKDLY